MLRYSMAAVMLPVIGSIFAASLPANADYYVVREKTTKKCKIVEKEPHDDVLVRVGPVAFKTRDEADRQIKIICKERYD